VPEQESNGEKMKEWFNTCLPMQFPPTNFLEMRIGSQFSSLDKKVRSVVPSVSGKRPA
jgi:hypothetical protein